MKLNAKSSGKMLRPALADRAFLANVEARLAATATTLAAEANAITKGEPELRLKRTGRGYRIAPRHGSAARLLEYGSLTVAPKPWAARLIARIRRLRLPSARRS